MRQKLIETRIFEFKVTERNKQNLREGVLMKMRGLGQRADERNANERIYSGSLWDRIFMDEKFQGRLKTREMLGEADHPEDGKTSIPRVSHVVTQVEREGNEIYVEIEILDTPAGRIVESLVAAGVKIGISSRGTGSVIERGGESYVNEDDFELETWDLVTNPSTRGAYPTRIESVETERNNKIVLQTAAQLCESETEYRELRTVKGIVADLQTKLFAEEKRDVLRHINESMKNTRKESAMNRKGVKRPVRTPIGQTVELAEALADKKATERIRESAQRVRRLRKENADLKETNRRMKARLEQLKKRNQRIREQDDEEDFGLDAEVVDEPTELEVDGIITIIPNESPGEEEEMPERRRVSRRRYLERRRRAMLREKGKACAAKDKKKMKNKRPGYGSANERRQLIAAKRVIEKQARELKVAKRIIEYMAHNTVTKKKYEKARTAVKKLMAEHGSSEWKRYVHERIGNLNPQDQKRILKAVGKPASLNEAKQRLDSVLDVARSRKTNERRKPPTSTREPMKGSKVKSLDERRQPSPATQKTDATNSLLETVRTGVEKSL